MGSNANLERLGNQHCVYIVCLSDHQSFPAATMSARPL